MRIADVLRVKGSVVATVTPDTALTGVFAVMAEHTVGAVVVVRDGVVVGIVWERDVIRHLHQHGISLVDAPIAEIMTTDVICCGPTDEVYDIMRTMTENRVRHLPVMVDDELRGIVSMGDLVKARIDELETERSHLQSYIAT